ncbi:TetR/AcrR family transcriptional regulator [Moraxella nasovis]|uniref:TetR/AcrR family transcriptional regulator n=1 Tax=Moraxella nasovis TaxID=2904121 RepID=UPI001F60A74F|nr:TetR/AcrR family transcriptional regulator [Moraxella nasovis]UNU73584.1 TetR/AcrR family transcriptional regulator [Moraxella nasovis]
MTDLFDENKVKATDSTPQKRKNNPELLRHTLLIAAKDIMLEDGIAQLSMQKVATLAGVSKGGLFHHFKSKDDLISSVVSLFIAQLNTAIISQIADQNAFGVFTTAYVRVFFDDKNIGLGSQWSGLIKPITAESSLRQQWQQWLDNKLHQHHKTDSDDRLHLVRMAVDGVWLNGVSTHELPRLKEHLLCAINSIK